MALPWEEELGVCLRLPISLTCPTCLRWVRWEAGTVLKKKGFTSNQLKYMTTGQMIDVIAVRLTKKERKEKQ